MQYLNSVRLSVFLFVVAVNSYSHADDDFYFELDTVITPTRTEIPIIDSPVSVTRLDLSYLSYLGLKEYDELLRLVPGFLVTHYQGHSPQVSYHGTQGTIPRRMEVLLDGDSIYRSGYARVNWGRLPVSEQDLNYIEVARGPSVSDYGSNSMLSAINLLSRKPQLDYGNYVEVRSGSHDTKSAFVKHGFGGDEAYSSIRYFQEQDEGFDVDGLGDEVDDGKENKSLFWHRRNERGSAVFESKLIYSESKYATHISSTDTVLNDVDSEERNIFLGGKYTSHMGTGADTFEIAFNLSNYKLEQTLDRCLWSGLFLDELKALDRSPNINLTPDTVLGLGSALPLLAGGGLSNPTLVNSVLTGIGIDVSVLELDDYVALSDLASRMFVEGSRLLDPVCGTTNQDVNETSAELDTLVKTSGERWINTFGVRFRVSRVVSETYLGGHVRDETIQISDHLRFNLSDKWVVNSGFMVETIKMKDIAFSPRGSLTYKFLPNQGVRMGVSHAERSPDIYETDRYWVQSYEFYGDYVDLDGNTSNTLYKTSQLDNELDPEEITEYEIGYYAKLIDLPISYDLKLFKSELRNLISEPFVYYDFHLSNESELDLDGVEMQLQYKSGPLVSGFVYAYLDSDTEQPLEETLYAEHAGSVYAIYSFDDDWHVGVAHYSNSVLATSSYDRSDVTVTKEFHSEKSRVSAQLNMRYMSNDVAHYAEGITQFVAKRNYGENLSVFLTLSAHFN